MERRADSAKQLSLPSEPVSAGATLARVPSMASSGAATGSQDALLFETPPDLVCPITFHLFRDPVINAAGQVYERAAIEQHLALKGTDPISGVVIQSNQLIPVRAADTQPSRSASAAAPFTARPSWTLAVSSHRRSTRSSPAPTSTESAWPRRAWTR